MPGSSVVLASEYSSGTMPRLGVVAEPRFGTSPLGKGPNAYSRFPGWHVLRAPHHLSRDRVASDSGFVAIP